MQLKKEHFQKAVKWAKEHKKTSYALGVVAYALIKRSLKKKSKEKSHSHDCCHSNDKSNDKSNSCCK